MDLPPSNSFCRMLTHKLADYYHMTHSFEAVASSVRIYRTPFCRIPPALSSIEVVTSQSSSPTPAVLPKKIMRRGEVGEFGSASASPSKPTSEDGSDAKDKGPLAKEKYAHPFSHLRRLQAHANQCGTGSRERSAKRLITEHVSEFLEPQRRRKHPRQVCSSSTYPTFPQRSVDADYPTQMVMTAMVYLGQALSLPKHPTLEPRESLGNNVAKTRRAGIRGQTTLLGVPPRMLRGRRCPRRIRSIILQPIPNSAGNFSKSMEMPCSPYSVPASLTHRV